MALLKSPHDIEGEKKKKMEKLKKQMEYSDAVKCTIKIPRNIYVKMRDKMYKQRKLHIQRTLMDLILEYVKNE